MTIFGSVFGLGAVRPAASSCWCCWCWSSWRRSPFALVVGAELPSAAIWFLAVVAAALTIALVIGMASKGTEDAKNKAIIKAAGA